MCGSEGAIALGTSQFKKHSRKQYIDWVLPMGTAPFSSPQTHLISSSPTPEAGVIPS